MTHQYVHKNRKELYKQRLAELQAPFGTILNLYQVRHSNEGRYTQPLSSEDFYLYDGKETWKMVL